MLAGFICKYYLQAYLLIKLNFHMPGLERPPYVNEISVKPIHMRNAFKFQCFKVKHQYDKIGFKCADRIKHVFFQDKNNICTLLEKSM